MSDPSPSTVALLGFSLPAMEGLQRAERPFVAVVPPDFTPYMESHDLPHVAWDFARPVADSEALAETLSARGVAVAVPLYEETVEWAGALNGRFRDDPRLHSRYRLFRDKGMMKRRAQMGGLRVGLFEEAEAPRHVRRFLQRVQAAQSKLDQDEPTRVHLKPIDAAGAFGHRVLKKLADVDKLDDDDFPCLLETHLDGQEFSAEVFVHDREIRFLNITEYIRLGHTNFVPASPALEARRPAIEQAVRSLVKAFDIEYGMIHPEFFITEDDVVSFGEVAARVPGGHIFELIHRAWGFDPFVAFAMCCDPSTTEAELEAFFPAPGEHETYAGCVMVYPKRKVIRKVALPDELLAHDYYERHDLFMPVNQKVAERVAYGDHYGSVFFAGPDPEVMRELLVRYDEHDFYTGPEDEAPAQEASEEAATA